MVTQSHHTCFRGVVTYLLLFYITVYNIVGSMQETVAVGGIMSICIYNLQLYFLQLNMCTHGFTLYYPPNTVCYIKLF